MTVHLEPASTLDVAALAGLFNEAFADYLIRFPAMTPEHFRRFLATQGINLELSRLARIGNEWVGFGFIHADGGLCSLAGMGVCCRVDGEAPQARCSTRCCRKPTNGAID